MNYLYVSENKKNTLCNNSEYLNNSNQKKFNRDESTIVLIPNQLIVDKSMNNYRCAFYSYLYLEKNTSGVIHFVIKDFLEWINRKFNNSKLNKSIKQLLVDFKNSNIIFYEGDEDFIDNLKINKKIDIFFLLKENYFKNNKNISYLYLDEIIKILSFNSDYLSNNSNCKLLLLCAYIRTTIFMRNFKLEVMNKKYKQENPESSLLHLDTICTKLDYNKYRIRFLIKALEELMIIKKFSLKIKRLGKDYFINPPSVFVNYYKRDFYNNLEYRGKDYYEDEVNNFLIMFSKNNSSYYESKVRIRHVR